MSKTTYFLLNLPNPPGKNIYRAFAGGFGTLGNASEDDNLIPQYLLYAASVFENKSRDYDVLDAQALNYSGKDVICVIKRSSPDVLIAWLSLPSLSHDMQVLDEIKTALPETLIIGYGTVCKVLSTEILENSKIDALIVGNYPYYTSTSNLITTLNGRSTKSMQNVPGVVFKENGRVISCPQLEEKENLDELNLGVYHRLPVKRYVSEYLDRSYKKISCIPILTAVGCPYGCTYCPYPLGYGKRILKKSTENIIKEIEFLMDNYGISGFMFREQAFTHNKKRVITFCDEVIRKGLEIKWFFETRADLVDRVLLEKMKEAGCFRIHYGVETGDERVLKKIGKPSMTKEKIKKAFMETKRAGISAHSHMMIGFPEEDEDTIKKSIQLLKEIEPDSVNINIVTPYPGTKFYEDIKNEGLLTNEDWSMFTSFEPVIKTEYLDENYLNKARNKMKIEFYKIKLKKDPEFRRFFLKSLPKKLRNRIRR